MSAVSSESVPALMWRRWRDPAAWSTSADIFAILIAVSLPWSTTLVAIFAAAFLVSVARFLDVRVFLQSLKRPICVLPVALFALAAAERSGRMRHGRCASMPLARPRNS